jgi:hypothetical protein
MTADFFRFPHTPHLAWLGEGSPRDDKVLSPHEVSALLGGQCGGRRKGWMVQMWACLLRRMGACAPRTGGNISDEPHAGQFARLPAWLAQHGEALRAVLRSNLILLASGVRHVTRWTMPHCRIGFCCLTYTTVQPGRFWSTQRRNALARVAGLITVPQVLHDKTTVTALKQLVAATPSRYRQGALEGVVIRRESADWCEARAKLVRPDFTQAIDAHWSKRRIEWNRVKHE